MVDSNFILVIVALAFSGWGCWRCIPRSVYFVFPEWVSTWFVEDSRVGLVMEAEVQRVVDELRVRGFVMLGIKIEKPPLWAASYHEISLASVELACFASIVHVRGEDLCYFYTPFTDGSLVLTANRGFNPRRLPGYIVAVTKSNEWQEMLRIHLENCEALRSEGRSPIEEFTRTSRVRATHTFYSAPATRRIMRRIGAVYFLVILLLLLLLLAMISKVLAVHQL